MATAMYLAMERAVDHNLRLDPNGRVHGQRGKFVAVPDAAKTILSTRRLNSLTEEVERGYMKMVDAIFDLPKEQSVEHVARAIFAFRAQRSGDAKPLGAFWHGLKTDRVIGAEIKAIEAEISGSVAELRSAKWRYRSLVTLVRKELERLGIPY